MNSKRLEVYNNISENLNDITNKINEIKLMQNYYINSEENKFAKLINYIENNIKNNLESIEELKKPFLLFIIGNGNYGKSTLINVLLKKSIVKTTDLPNTWKIDMFIFNSTEKIEIVYEDRSCDIYKFNRGKTILEKEEDKYQISRKKVSKLVKEYKKKHNDYRSDDLKEIKLRLEEKYLYKSDIEEVHYYINKSAILKNFIIVDTPGLNQNLLQKTKKTMDYYYSRADGIIWIMDAQNIVSRKSNLLINEIKQINSIGKNKKNIIGVVNKIDIVGKNNIEKIKSKTKEVFSDCFNDIVFISAKIGLEGVVKNNCDYIESSNINSLYESIEKNLKITSETNQINSKKANISIMKNNITNEVEKYKRELYLDISKYNEIEYSLINQIECLKNYISNKLTSLTNQNYSDIQISRNVILENIQNIENICNSSLNKIYNNILITSNISNENDDKNLKPKVNFTKNKYIPKINEMTELILYNKNHINSKIDTGNLFNTRCSINNTIKQISEEIMKILQENIELFLTNINNLRKNIFRENHTEYDNYKQILKSIEEIENILDNMEEIDESCTIYKR